MAQDIRELFKNEEKRESFKIPKGHQARFEQKLDNALPEKKSQNTFFAYKIAAVLVVLFSVGYLLFQNNHPVGNEVVGTSVEEQDVNKATVADEKEVPQVTLADISPEYKKIEDYYMASFNLGLSQLEITKENKALIDSFMAQLAELDKEYARLNKEFVKTGTNSETVEALIRNLQLRLELLFKLKNKLEELKKENHDNYENNRA
ncbi:MAG TPA: hypothetical protein VFM59_07015 [Salinimicrobium sp.]|nr:hypothetical protein [Salinimicrobium sp.]